MPKIKDAFKRYVNAVVTKYKSSPAIMAWELANEPRCAADSKRNLPRSPNGCSPAVLTAWVKEMSAYIKSLDPNHLVTTGGEGGFNIQGNSDGFYNGYDGGDFEEELKIASIDFGTFHSYPDWWSKTVQWTVQWIKDHAVTARKVGKPVVHEEYGMCFLRVTALFASPLRGSIFPTLLYPTVPHTSLLQDRLAHSPQTTRIFRQDFRYYTTSGDGTVPSSIACRKNARYVLAIRLFKVFVWQES